MNITGDHPPTVNLGYLKTNDILKIKILVPGINSADISNYIELRQGTLTNDKNIFSYINVMSGNSSTHVIT